MTGVSISRCVLCVLLVASCAVVVHGTVFSDALGQLQLRTDASSSFATGSTTHIRVGTGVNDKMSSMLFLIQTTVDSTDYINKQFRLTLKECSSSSGSLAFRHQAEVVFLADIGGFSATSGLSHSVLEEFFKDNPSTSVVNEGATPYTGGALGDAGLKVFELTPAVLLAYERAGLAAKQGQTQWLYVWVHSSFDSTAKPEGMEDSAWAQIQPTLNYGVDYCAQESAFTFEAFATRTPDFERVELDARGTKVTATFTVPLQVPQGGQQASTSLCTTHIRTTPSNQATDKAVLQDFGSGATCRFLSSQKFEIALGGGASPSLKGRTLDLEQSKFVNAASSKTLGPTQQAGTIRPPYVRIPSVLKGPVVSSPEKIGLCGTFEVMCDGGGAQDAPKFTRFVLTGAYEDGSPIGLRQVAENLCKFKVKAEALPLSNPNEGQVFRLIVTGVNSNNRNASTTVKIKKEARDEPVFTVSGPAQSSPANALLFSAVFRIPEGCTLPQKFTREVTWSVKDSDSGADVSESVEASSFKNSMTFKIGRNKLNASTAYDMEAEAVATFPDGDERSVRGRAKVVIQRAFSIPIIKGGDRSHPRWLDLEVDGSQSFDPNVPPGIPPPPLAYRWSCRGGSGGTCSELSFDASAAVLNFPSSSLGADAIYTFALRVAPAAGPAANEIDSLAAVDETVVISVRGPAVKASTTFAPDVRIKSVSGTNAGETIRIFTETTAAPDSGATRDVAALSYEWRDITNTALPPQTLTPDQVGTSGNNPHLIVKPNAFTVGVEYKLRLTVRDERGDDASVAFVDQRIKVNAPPTGGGVSVEPTSGTAFNTTFELSAFGWLDESPSDQPLQYTFAIHKAGQDEVPVSAPSQSPSWRIQLPVGEWTVILYASDVLGAFTRTESATVNVTLPIRSTALTPAACIDDMKRAWEDKKGPESAGEDAQKLVVLAGTNELLNDDDCKVKDDDGGSDDDHQSAGAFRQEAVETVREVLKEGAAFDSVAAKQMAIVLKNVAQAPLAQVDEALFEQIRQAIKTIMTKLEGVRGASPSAPPREQKQDPGAPTYVDPQPMLQEAMAALFDRNPCARGAEVLTELADIAKGRLWKQVPGEDGINFRSDGLAQEAKKFLARRKGDDGAGASTASQSFSVGRQGDSGAASFVVPDAAVAAPTSGVSRLFMLEKVRNSGCTVTLSGGITGKNIQQASDTASATVRDTAGAEVTVDNLPDDARITVSLPFTFPNRSSTLVHWVYRKGTSGAWVYGGTIARDAAWATANDTAPAVAQFSVSHLTQFAVIVSDGELSSLSRAIFYGFGVVFAAVFAYALLLLTPVATVDRGTREWTKLKRPLSQVALVAVVAAIKAVNAFVFATNTDDDVPALALAVMLAIPPALLYWVFTMLIAEWFSLTGRRFNRNLYADFRTQVRLVFSGVVCVVLFAFVAINVDRTTFHKPAVVAIGAMQMVFAVFLCVSGFRLVRKVQDKAAGVAARFRFATLTFTTTLLVAGGVMVALAASGDAFLAYEDVYVAAVLICEAVEVAIVLYLYSQRLLRAGKIQCLAHDGKRPDERASISSMDRPSAPSHSSAVPVSSTKRDRVGTSSSSTDAGLELASITVQER